MHENESEWDEDNDDEGRTFNNEGRHASDDSDDTGGRSPDIPMETLTWDDNLTDPEPSGDKPRQSNGVDAVPWRSQRRAAPSAAGATLRGLSHTSRVEQAIEEVRKSAKCSWEERNPAHVTQEMRWVPLSPDCEESAMMSSNTDPKTWREAMDAADAAQWIEGLEEEMASLRAHNMFTLVPRHAVPPGCQIIKSRPHCHRKHNEHGVVVCHKVRVVAKGYTQVPSVDFKETFAPVMRLESM